MTLERIKGDISFTCDGPLCHEFLETETHEFEEAKELLRDAKWSSEKMGATLWSHYCPLCKSRKPDMGKLLS